MFATQGSHPIYPTRTCSPPRLVISSHLSHLDQLSAIHLYIHCSSRAYRSRVPTRGSHASAHRIAPQDSSRSTFTIAINTLRPTRSNPFKADFISPNDYRASASLILPQDNASYIISVARTQKPFDNHRLITNTKEGSNTCSTILPSSRTT